MERKLSELLSSTRLPEPTKLVLDLAPGCLFGYPPDNLEEIMERAKCSYCRAIMEVIRDCADKQAAVERRVEELLQPVRDRNEAKRKRYQAWRKWLGPLVPEPAFEPEPVFGGVAWYEQAMDELIRLSTLLEPLAGGDVSHWGDPASRAASKEVVSRYVRGSAYVLSL